MLLGLVSREDEWWRRQWQLLLLAAIGTATAFATLHEMINTDSLLYFVEHALR